MKRRWAVGWFLVFLGCVSGGCGEEVGDSSERDLSSFGDGGQVLDGPMASADMTMAGGDIAGADLHSTGADMSMVIADMTMAVVDMTSPRDMTGMVVDLVPSPDLVPPADLMPPADLTVPADLTMLPDMAVVDLMPEGDMTSKFSCADGYMCLSKCNNQNCAVDCNRMINTPGGSDLMQQLLGCGVGACNQVCADPQQAACQQCIAGSCQKEVMACLADK